MRMGIWMHAQSTAWFARSESVKTIGDTDSYSCGLVQRDLMMMAIPSTQFGQVTDSSSTRDNLAYWCGACAELVGPTGKRARVQIVTQRTPDPGQEISNAYSIDLPASIGSNVDTPFSMIEGNTCVAGGVSGLPVDYQIVPCEVCGGIVLAFDQWAQIRVHNHRLPIVRVEYESGGSWKAIHRDSVNQFYEPSGLGATAHLRITAIDGSTIDGTFPTSKGAYEADTQF